MYIRLILKWYYYIPICEKLESKRIARCGHVYRGTGMHFLLINPKYDAWNVLTSYIKITGKYWLFMNKINFQFVWYIIHASILFIQLSYCKFLYRTHFSFLLRELGASFPHPTPVQLYSTCFWKKKTCHIYYQNATKFKQRKEFPL